MPEQRLSGPAALFYAYAHEDETLREQVEQHLALLQRQGLLLPWHDRQIEAGEDWKHAIDEHLEAASIILLLISPAFLASDYCYEVEMQRALERHKQGEARVIPVILRPCDWQTAPFEHLQALPRDGRAVTTWTNQDEAFLQVSQSLRMFLTQSSHIYSPAQSASTPSSTTPEQIWNVPYQPSLFFTGRENILKQLYDKLMIRNSTRPLALCGIGGVGKTQIALAYASIYRSEYQAVLWVRANSESLTSELPEIAKLPGIIGKELEVSSENIRPSVNATDRLLFWLNTHSHWLLIFDDADNLEELAKVIPTTGRGHILLTTRSQHTGTIAERIVIEQMNVEDSTQFLFRRAYMNTSETSVMGVSKEGLINSAKEIIQEMEGLPLALDQAGAYIAEAECSLSEYLDLYRKCRAEFLKCRGSSTPDHPDSVVATFSLCFGRVKQVMPIAAEMLYLCAFLHPEAIPENIIVKGIFEPRTELHPSTDYRNELSAAIKELRKFSLIQRNPETKTLTIHRLVQAVLIYKMEQQDIKQKWVMCTIQAVHHALQGAKAAGWPEYQPHVQVCAKLIEQNSLIFPESTDFFYQVGNYLIVHQQYHEGIYFLQLSLFLRKKILPREHIDLVRSLESLAEVYDYLLPNSGSRFPNSRWNYQRAWNRRTVLLLFHRALFITEKLLGSDHPDLISKLEKLAILYYECERYGSAISLLKQSIAISKKHLGPEHLDLIPKLDRLADFYCLWKEEPDRLLEAQELYGQALSLSMKIFGPEHINYVSRLDKLAAFYQTQKRYSDATRLLEQSLSISRNILEPDHPDLIQKMDVLAKSYLDQGNPDQAESLYRQDLAASEKRLGADHRDLIQKIDKLVQFYFDQCKYDQGLALSQRVLHLSIGVLGPKDPHIIPRLKRIAQFYDSLEQHDQAQSTYQRAWSLSKKALGSEHPTTLSIQKELEKYLPSSDSPLENEIKKRTDIEGPIATLPPWLLWPIVIIIGIPAAIIAAVVAVAKAIIATCSPFCSTILKLWKSLDRQLENKIKKRTDFERAIAALLMRLLLLILIIIGVPVLVIAKATMAICGPFCNTILKVSLFRNGSRQVETTMPQLPEKQPNDTSLQREKKNFHPIERARPRVPGPAKGFEALETIRSHNRKLHETDELRKFESHFKSESHFETESYFEYKLADCEKRLGSEHPETISRMRHLARFYMCQDNNHQAQQLYKRVLSTCEKHLGSEHPETISSSKDLAGVYFVQSQRDKGSLVDSNWCSFIDHYFGLLQSKRDEDIIDLPAFLHKRYGNR